MGLDCPNIRKVIHWGPPSDIESYLQETELDVAQANSILYYNKTDFRAKHIEHSVKVYCRNTHCCRRELILKDFDDCSPNQESECVCVVMYVAPNVSVMILHVTSKVIHNNKLKLNGMLEYYLHAFIVFHCSSPLRDNHGIGNKFVYVCVVMYVAQM